ncbi:hypothetical protein B4907_14605 [Yersinia kristensenii]|nr:hypothetical protein B4907_14605 [Yersinia kristensenii]
MSHFTWTKEVSFNMRFNHVNIGFWDELTESGRGQFCYNRSHTGMGLKRGKATGSQLFPKVMRVGHN